MPRSMIVDRSTAWALAGLASWLSILHDTIIVMATIMVTN